ncbi:hypothetical protein DEO72_LG2g3258 [Vigna unguiculata]|uniref:Uncharacterized protein n=1 Tax=Vigna unguiculata TaxID=3917 RepID=A0A4D6L368_VIGUN|nr:hypothetical protein DEO72_LG2g3258 [Vigna unguiculata]
MLAQATCVSVERQRLSLKREWLALRGHGEACENGSPKRGRDEIGCFPSLNPRPGEELCVLSELWARPGEESSPKRDEVVQPLLHARSGEVGWLKRG